MSKLKVVFEKHVVCFGLKKNTASLSSMLRLSQYFCEMKSEKPALKSENSDVIQTKSYLCGKIISSIFVFSIFVSCTSEKDLLSNFGNTQMTMGEKRSSTYANKNLGGKHYVNLPDLMSGFNKIKFYENQHHSLDSLETKIEYDGDKKLTVSFLDSTSVLQSFDLKVKNKGNYLSVKRKTFLIPIPFFFFIQKDRKAIIYNDVEGNLIIVSGEYQLIWVLFAGGNNFIHENKFELIK